MWLIIFHGPKEQRSRKEEIGWKRESIYLEHTILKNGKKNLKKNLEVDEK
jgi:hypothetical protein